MSVEGYYRNLEFKVNDYITLRLEDRETVIYVKNRRFDQCKYVLIDISVDKFEQYDDIESIDDAIGMLGRQGEDVNLRAYGITPETIFWGHCSNLQAWAELDYDTRILHSNLSFPLLKKLVDAGDPKAKKVFKEEIAKRFNSGSSHVRNFLKREGYLKYFNGEELSLLNFELFDYKLLKWATLKVRLSSANKISDIQELSTPTKLRALLLADNNITEMDGLENAPNVEFLDLTNNHIREIKGLESCTNLRVLRLGKNQISEIKGLDPLTRLEELELYENQITRIQGLENLTSLKRIRIYHNPIKPEILHALGPTAYVTRPQEFADYCRKLSTDSKEQ